MYQMQSFIMDHTEYYLDVIPITIIELVLAHTTLV